MLTSIRLEGLCYLWSSKKQASDGTILGKCKDNKERSRNEWGECLKCSAVLILEIGEKGRKIG